MDDSVIDLSSDDELSPSPKKRPAMDVQTTSMRLAANKQLTIRKTVQKINNSSSPKMPLILNNKTIEIKKTSSQHALQSNNIGRTPMIHQKKNNEITANVGKKTASPIPASAPSRSGCEGKSFQKKISTGELTLLPIVTIADKPKDAQFQQSKPEAKSSSSSSSSTTTTTTTVIKQKRESPIVISKASMPTESRPTKRRVVPTKISDDIRLRSESIENSNDSDMLSRDSSANDEATTSNQRPPLKNDDNSTGKSDKSTEPEVKHRKETPLNETFELLIETCRAADPSSDMNKMIDRKLIKYYQRVHPDFVNSKSFLKAVQKVIGEIKAHPKFVYLKINGLLEELNTRRQSDRTIVEVDEDEAPTITPTTGDAKKDMKIQRLSKALYKLKKLIAKNEEAEVDWDDDINSKFMITERYKKRAWQIYSKICDITGESKSAERLVKKPIRFKGTTYPEFNRKLEKFVNDTQSFPDLYDVIRILNYCNDRYNYRLNKEVITSIAQRAFVKVGTSLQKRRKTDLYEMVTYFTNNQRDPALEDPTLRTKLDENLKKHKEKMREVIDKFTRQDHGEEVDADASTSNNLRNEDQNSSHETPTASTASTAPKPPTTKLPPVTEMTDENLLNVSDDVILVNEPVVDDDLLGEITRNIEENDLEDAFNMNFQIESVESLHPSLLPFDENPVVIDDSL